MFFDFVVDLVYVHGSGERRILSCLEYSDGKNVSVGRAEVEDAIREMKDKKFITDQGNECYVYQPV